MEEARSLGELLKQGWKPKRTIILLRLGWRRARAAGLHRMGRRRMPDELRKHAVVVYQLRHQRPRISGHRRLAHPGALHQRRGTRHPGSGNQAVCVEAGPALQHRRIRIGAIVKELRATGPICALARWAPAPITRRSSTSSGHRLARSWLRRRSRRRRRLSLHLRRFLLVHAFCGHRFRLWRALSQPPGRR